MPRYDERSGPTRLVRDVDMKQDFAFVNFSDSRDADEARHFLNGRTFDGSRMVVEFAKPRGGGGGGGGGGGFRDYGSSREHGGRGPPPGTGRCYNCGHDGHWARDCKAGDWKNKCYRCGQRGHIERNCRSSPRRNRSRSRSLSRSPVAGRRRSRSPSYDRSRSRSPRKEDRSPAEGEQAQRLSPSRSRSRTPTRREAQSGSVSPVGNGRSPAVERLPEGGSRSASQSPLRPDDDQDSSPVKNIRSPSHSGGD